MPSAVFSATVSTAAFVTSSALSSWVSLPTIQDSCFTAATKSPFLAHISLHAFIFQTFRRENLIKHDSFEQVCKQWIDRNGPFKDEIRHKRKKQPLRLIRVLIPTSRFSSLLPKIFRKNFPYMQLSYLSNKWDEVTNVVAKIRSKGETRCNGQYCNHRLITLLKILVLFIGTSADKICRKTNITI